MKPNIMLITQEHQTQLVANYAKDHTTDEVLGFIDDWLWIGQFW